MAANLTVIFLMHCFCNMLVSFSFFLPCILHLLIWFAYLIADSLVCLNVYYEHFESVSVICFYMCKVY